MDHGLGSSATRSTVSTCYTPGIKKFVPCNYYTPGWGKIVACKYITILSGEKIVVHE